MLVFSSSVVIVLLVLGGVVLLFGSGVVLRRAWRVITAPFRWGYGLWVQHQLTRAAIREAEARAQNELLWYPKTRDEERKST